MQMHWQLFGPLVVVGSFGPGLTVVLCVVGTVGVTVTSNDVVGTVTIGREVVLSSSHVGQYTGQATGAGGGFGVALQLLVHSLG